MQGHEGFEKQTFFSRVQTRASYRDSLLQHRGGRVGEAGVDVAEALEVEERSGVVDVVKHVTKPEEEGRWGSRLSFHHIRAFCVLCFVFCVLCFGFWVCVCARACV